MTSTKLTLVHKKELLISDPLSEVHHPNVREYGMTPNELLIIRQHCAELYEKSNNVETWSKTSLRTSWINTIIATLAIIVCSVFFIGDSENVLNGSIFRASVVIFIICWGIFAATFAVSVMDTITFRKRKKEQLAQIEEKLAVINRRHDGIKLVYDSANEPQLLIIEFYKPINVDDAWIPQEDEIEIGRAHV